MVGTFRSKMEDMIAASEEVAICVPRAMLAMCLDYIEGDSEPQGHDPERELLISQLRVHLNDAALPTAEDVRGLFNPEQ